MNDDIINMTPDEMAQEIIRLRELNQQLINDLYVANNKHEEYMKNLHEYTWGRKVLG